MAMNAGLAAYIAKKRGASSGPTPLQQAAAARLTSEKTPPSKGGKFAPKKKANPLPESEM